MGILTLLSTTTSSNAATASITSNIDNTYDEYMFVMNNVNPATDNVHFLVNFSVDGGSNYNASKITTHFLAVHKEDDTVEAHAYSTGNDTASGLATAAARISTDQGNDADQCISGIFYLFSPANTTYVTHFSSTMTGARTGAHDEAVESNWVAGYVNVTSAVDAIQFSMSSGNMDGVIQMYGVA